MTEEIKETKQTKENEETNTQSLAIKPKPEIQQEPQQDLKITKQNNDDLLRQVVIQQLQTGELATLELTKEQEEILYAPVKDEDIDIRPDGLVYASWIFYATRLRKAFGMKWALMPASAPKTTTTKDGKPCILWDFYLFIGGKYVAYAVGEHIEERMGRGMSYTESLESAKSNALMRCCKQIGIGLELWDRMWIERWKRQYAQSYEEFKNGYKKTFWRRKPQTQSKTETAKATQPVAKTATQSQQEEPANDNDQTPTSADLSKFWMPLLKAKFTNDEVHKILREDYGIESVKQIPKSELQNFVKVLLAKKGGE